MSSTSTADLPFHDRTDFEDADRGFVGALDPCVVTDASGRVVWDNDAYAFLEGECPDTANPSLWRQGQLMRQQGLYEVSDGIYQVRGLDLSNMTLVEGDDGVIVIDPLISAETAAAALALYRTPPRRPAGDRRHLHPRPRRPLRRRARRARRARCRSGPGRLHGVGGVGERLRRGRHERAGPSTCTAHRWRRACGQIGRRPRDDQLAGTVGLVAPHPRRHPHRAGGAPGRRPHRFQITPGTECPVEMNFYFPHRRALCMAENATHNLHNLVTLRGALVRDARIWSAYLDEAIDLFGADTDVAFASHHWPMWGGERVGDVPVAPAGPLRLPPRPDAAADEPGLQRCRDGRGDGDATGARGGVAHPRVLRVGQPQREGRLPALPRDGSTATRHGCGSTRRSRRGPLRRGHRRRRRRRRNGRGLRAGATSGSPPSCSTRWSSPSPTTPGPGNSWPACTTAWATGPRTARGATST